MEETQYKLSADFLRSKQFVKLYEIRSNSESECSQISEKEISNMKRDGSYFIKLGEL